MNPNIKKLLSWIFKAALSIAFIWFVNRAVSFDRLSAVIASASLLPLLMSAVAGVLSLVMQAERWRIILRAEEFPCDRATVWRTFLTGCLFGFITPGRAGEFLRGVGLASGRTGDSMFAVLVDKLYGLLITMGVGLAALPIYAMRFNVPFTGRMLYFVLGGVSVLAAAAFVLTQGAPGGKRSHLRGHVRRLFEQLPRLMSPSGRIALYLSIGAHVLLMVQAAALLFSLAGVPFLWGLFTAALAFAAISLLPISFGNMGVREGMFALFLSGMGLLSGHVADAASVALSLSIGILAVNILLPAGAGLFWIMIDKISTSAPEGSGSGRQGDAA